MCHGVKVRRRHHRLPCRPKAAAPDAVIAAIAQVIQSGGKAAMLLGGQALREPALLEAGKIAARLV